MQNCPLETAQIASVMALNAQNRKTYGALPRTLPPLPCFPVARVLILGMSAFVTKPNHYPKMTTAKSAWIKACIPLHILTC